MRAFFLLLQTVTAIETKTMENFLITNFLVSVILQLDHFDTFTNILSQNLNERCANSVSSLTNLVLKVVLFLFSAMGLVFTHTSDATDAEMLYPLFINSYWKFCKYINLMRGRGT